uniref:cAMP-dependent protein kinase type II regulatory subunit n=1 Tax=Cacopsylla melanoneura TaxID=428564 RepID=A0A8D8RHC7_9HEMI
MNRAQLGKVSVPDELRDILLEFTISYLLEQPSDVIDYGVEFFTKLKQNRRTTPEEPTTPEDDIDDEPPVARFNTRRKSVYAESYNPEDDEEDEGPKVIYPKSDEQRRSLAESVKKILIFRSLDNDQMNDVIDAMFEKPVEAGDLVIRQGDDGDFFYVIEQGRYEASVEIDGIDKLMHSYEDKGSFGELALLYNMPRAATIKATSKGSLWAMDRKTFKQIVLKSAFKKRKMYEKLLDAVPMLKSLQSYERMNLADALLPRAFEDGTRIIKQGDAADGMYFLEEGTCRITIYADNGQEVEIKKVDKGGYFGELALVTHKPRAASVYAYGNVKLAFLDVETFERLLGPCMEVLKRNINDYESQLVKIFGSKYNISDIR